LLNREDKLAVAILRYYSSDCVVLVRSPLNTTHGELKNITECEVISDNNANIKSIQMVQKEACSKMVFGYRTDDGHSIAQEIYQKDEINRAS
jgi:hypothetical protein